MLPNLWYGKWDLSPLNRKGDKDVTWLNRMGLVNQRGREEVRLDQRGH